MKTTEFIVEYAGIGEDADAMSADHEVQLARQQCYNAARDAIALHHILKDTPEQENLEDWVVEKLTQAASNLKDVIEHLEELRSGSDGEEMEIMSAFSFESAEAKFAEVLGEAQLNELNPERYAEYEYQQQNSPRGFATMPTASTFVIIDRASGRKYPQRFKVRSEAERAAARLGGFGKVKVTSEDEELENDADPITELKLKPEFAGADDGAGVDTPARSPAAKTAPGVKVTKVGADTYRVSYNGKSIECSRREVPHYKQQIVGESQVNELDTSTMQSYLQKRKETPAPHSVHKAVNQAQGVRSAHEKIHDKLVKKIAIQGGDTRVKEETVTELNKDTLYSYKNKANKDFDTQIAKSYKAVRANDPKTANAAADKATRRLNGAEKADTRLAHGVDEGKFTVNAKTGAKLNPRTGAELPAKEKPMTVKQFLAPKKSAAPKLTLNDVWRKVEDVVGQIIPDGDPIDWLLPWFEKQGIADHKVGDILRRAAKANGYKDMYDYYDQMKNDLAADYSYGESVEQVDELSPGTLKAYIPKANRSREQATNNMYQTGKFDPKVDDKMGRRAEFTMKAKNKVAQPVTELSKNTLGSYAKKANAARSHEPDDRKADNRGTGVMKALDKISGGKDKGGALKGKAVTARFSASKGGATANKDRADFEKAVDRNVAKESVVKENATSGATSVGGIAAGVAGAKVRKPGTGIPKSLGNKVKKNTPDIGKGVY